MGPYLGQPITEKICYKAENNKLGLKFSRCEMQGWRRAMQDAAISQLDIGNGNSIFAIFDGHGGPEVAKFVEKHFLAKLKACKHFKEERYYDALTDTFKRLDEAIDSNEGEQELKGLRRKTEATYNDNPVYLGTGCTACVVLVTSTKIITANAGDSRAVLCRQGKAVPLSFDHKPGNESQRKRVEAAGGEVVNGRVNGALNLSRSLGDFNFKRQKHRAYDQQLIICRPDVTEIQRNLEEDEFIILGCDGIWQRYAKDSQLMITKLLKDRSKQKDSLNLLSTLLDECLASDTTSEMGCDNMSAILIDFL